MTKEDLSYMKLIIQIPCYNEEATLPQTIADLPKSIEGIDEIEFLIINDGSTDKTVETARACGVTHIISFKNNQGLAHGFKAGIDACLRLGADIIVNTDADNQYCGEDIKKLIVPILDGRADMVIGERPIEDTAHFSQTKKRMQKVGSSVVRMLSQTLVPDAPSGFRAYTKDAALRLNVINEYTYTLESIIQAGINKTAIISVPIRTNPETRKSRLFKGIWSYIWRSGIVIIRAILMYRPMRFFFSLGITALVIGLAVIGRFLYTYFTGNDGSHIQSLILAGVFVTIGVQFIITGLQADIIAANRKLLEDIQLRVKRLELNSNGE